LAAPAGLARRARRFRWSAPTKRPLLAAIETLTKQTLSRDEEPGFEPDHRVPMTNGAGQLVKKPKKPKVPGGRAAKNLPSNWEGFDGAPAKPARRSAAKATNSAGGKAPGTSRGR
jgi:ATP-dependent RNA helicase RhlE